MKIAVLANLKAGGGGKAAAVLQKIAGAWSAHELLAAAGFGGEQLSRCIFPEEAEGYVPRLNAAVRALLSAGPDLLVTVGGDGAAAYAAECVIAEGSKVPLLGIGAGTANVGPIVSFGAEELPDPDSLAEISLGAVEARNVQGRHIAYGFNDIVIGNTFLGTSAEGETRTFSGRELAAFGRLTEEAPVKDLFRGPSSMSLNGRALAALPYRAAQMVVSPVEPDNFYGRPYTGILCFTPGSEFKAAVYLGPNPVVSMEDDDAGISCFRTGGQLLLTEKDSLRLDHLNDNVCAVADGNPYLLPEGSVTLQYVPDVIRVLKRRRL